MSLDLNEVVRLLAAGNIPSPRLEARILLEHIGGSPFAEVDGEAEQKLRRLVERRLVHVPLDKLLGRREFYKNDFIVSEDVLTPRPDTEILVEAAVGLVRRNGLKRILDLGTGSGCIILSILDDCPQACGTAVDKSAAALEIARRNAALGLFQADIMQALFVVFVGFALRFGGLAVSLYFFLGAEAAVRAALFDQLPRVLGVEVAALGLDIRAVIAADIRTFVIGQARLTHGLVNQIDRAGHFALLIGIFDAEDEISAFMFGDQVFE